MKKADEILAEVAQLMQEIERLRSEQCSRNDLFEIYKSILSGIDDLAYVCDNEGNILYVNDVFEEYTGHKPSEFIGRTFAPLFDEEELKKALDVYKRTLDGEKPRYELRFKKTGIICEYKNFPLTNKDGAVTGVIGISRDVTKRKAAEDALRAERDRAQNYLDIANVIFVVITADEKVALINRKGCDVLGFKEDGIIGKNWFDSFIPEGNREKVRDVFKKIMAGEAALLEYFENTVLTAEGEERLIAWHNTVLKGGDGKVYATLSSGNDITEVKALIEELDSYRSGLEELVEMRTKELTESNRQLHEEVAERKRVEFELKKLNIAIEQSANIVFITDACGNFEYVNPMFEQMSGYSRAEVIGKNPEMLEPVDGDGVYWENILTEAGWQGELKNRKKDGGFFWTKGIVSPIRDDSGRVGQYLAVFEDVSKEMLASEKILFLAHYDGITGLINRSRFIELLNDWLSEASNQEGSGALLLLDIDQFKFISDTYGHGMGDEFLRRVAKLLQVTMRYVNGKYLNNTAKEGFLCRLSGDEFALFLPSIGRVEAVVMAEQIRKGLESFYQPDVQCHLTVSIGVSLFPEHGRSTTELLTKADAAMYKAKDLGRNRFHFYSPEDRDLEQMHSRLKWKENIVRALKEDRFEPWFQPIMDLGKNEVSHYEALARMRDGEGNILLPGPFIDIAERFGLVGSIGRVIVEKSMRLQSELSRQGNPLTFCINLSGKELGDREFLYFLQSRIYELGVDPGKIVFEITETASILDLDRAMSFLSELKAMGCRISLDDFGIGFTSFLYLKEMDVDYIKIAGSFIKNMENNINDQLFVKAITDVAKGMGIKTIAEFVERGETVELLRKYGVDYAQGYLIGKPKPVLEFKPFGEARA